VHAALIFACIGPVEAACRVRWALAQGPTQRMQKKQSLE